MTKETAERLREARETAMAALPERLQRLNQELAIDRTKDFDNDLYAVRGEYRFRVSVFRGGHHGFVATTSAGGRVHRYSGATPVDAFIKLTGSLVWLTARMDHEKQVAYNESRRYETA